MISKIKLSIIKSTSILCSVFSQLSQSSNSLKSLLGGGSSMGLRLIDLLQDPSSSGLSDSTVSAFPDSYSNLFD